MKMVTTTTTLEQREAAKQAAVKNYYDKIGCPDRKGWKAGKCPVSEYYGKIAEIGAANYMGYDWKQLCLYSPNKADYTKPDIGDWDIKAGSSFTDKDIAKGVRNILWVTPWNTGKPHYCGFDTCGHKVHLTLSGVVEIRGWTSTDDLHLCSDFGGYYKPTGDAFRNVATLPAFEWGVAA